MVHINPATPADFDGDREKGRIFFNSVCVYLSALGSLFPNDQAQIHWVLSYFKTDRAARFANKVIRLESKSRGHYFRDWDAFEKGFIRQFCLRDEHVAVLMKLEGTSWYQTQDSVDGYIDQFQELIDLTEYDDDKAIVIIFC